MTNFLTNVVIVTYNRLALLKRCLHAIANQTCTPNRVLVINNASTDGTVAWLSEWLPPILPQAEIHTLSENIGGAGGFAEGLRIAVSGGADWVWMMDDDAEPQPDALQALVDAVEGDENIYGSVATPDGQRLCWPLYSLDGREFDSIASMPDKVSAAALPFLGFMVPRRVVQRIGYPDAGYFLAGDDTEYCFRARAAGISIIGVKGSRLSHPASDYYRFGFGPVAPVCFYIAPWKRYYDVRNRIITASKDGTLHVWVKTLPATMLRLLATLIREPNRLKQLKAYAAGAFDGLRGVKGRRHQRWHLDA